MAHIVLLGDSIFDNKVYVGINGKDVIAHLRNSLPDDWQATLKAVDGSIIENVSEQLLDLPAVATHFVISVGGKKIAAKILELIDKHEFSTRRSQVFA